MSNHAEPHAAPEGGKAFEAMSVHRLEWVVGQRTTLHARA